MAFHTHGGWFWERLPDGRVRVTLRKSNGAETDVQEEHILDPYEWASVMAQVSLNGENDQSYHAAVKFHVEGRY